MENLLRSFDFASMVVLIIGHFNGFIQQINLEAALAIEAVSVPAIKCLKVGALVLECKMMPPVPNILLVMRKDSFHGAEWKTVIGGENTGVLN
jgi:hypothetical protein